MDIESRTAQLCAGPALALHCGHRFRMTFISRQFLSCCKFMRFLRSLFGTSAIIACLSASAQLPQVISYQGRLSASGTNFTGVADFGFALVSRDGTDIYWSNDGSASQPSNAISIAVTSGLFSVLLGDVALSNMVAVSATVFTNSEVWLRIWVRTGTNAFVRLEPDQRITAVGYAMMAASVTDGAITDRHVSQQAGISAAKISGLPQIPQGIIVMWSGSLTNIPAGWVLCDGSNGSPNLRDRFVVGASAVRSVGATGGSEAHSHSASTGIGSTRTGDGGGTGGSRSDHTHPVTVTTTNHLPPFYALAFIRKL